MYKKLSPWVGITAGASSHPEVIGARKNGAREGLRSGAFCRTPLSKHKKSVAISSSLLNVFLKFASLVYVRLQHRSQTEISLRFIDLFIGKVI